MRIKMTRNKWKLLAFEIFLLFVILAGVSIGSTIHRRHKEMKLAKAESLVKKKEAVADAPKKPFVAYMPKTVLVIDAGHGGDDEGTLTLDETVLEKDINLSLVKLLKEKYLDNVENLEVHYTRLNDKNVPLKKRVKMANKLNADLFLSIHVNASDYRESSAYGMEVLYSKRDNDKQISNKDFANVMLDNMVASSGNRSRGIIKRDDLYILNHSKVPAALLEVGYISNPDDLEMMTSREGQEKIVKGIFQGIVDFVGGSYE